MKNIAVGTGDLGFDSRASQISVATVRHRCDVSSELCCPGAKSRRWINHSLHTQMAEWYRASCLLSCRLGFDSESGQTNDFKIGIHSFPA